ncbi:MAG: hypothetical protein WDN23_01825 [Edaphobacter sp.]
MNEFDINTSIVEGESGGYRDLSPAVGFDARLAELEIENSRLHRLVAELLIKNEQLRKTD